MTTGTAGTTARQYSQQMIHYLRKGITYADDGTTVDVGTIPAGSLILKPLSGVYVNTAFNGATTNTLDIGPSTDSGTNLWGTLLALGAIAHVPLDEAVAIHGCAIIRIGDALAQIVDHLLRILASRGASGSCGHGEFSEWKGREKAAVKPPSMG